MNDKTDDVLVSLGARRNVLLYGPPATGKTRLIGKLFRALREPASGSQGITLDPSDSSKPFDRPEQHITIPLPAKVVWTTFHQSYGYEDFVLGLRPSLDERGTRLEPWAGVFLDAALELSDGQSKYKSVVIFIDEINRGNAARIFGEFMTFLDFDYRESGEVPLPLPLRQLGFIGGRSEEIHRPDGSLVRVPEGFRFPEHVYVVATMNSVDRSAVPIDSALARRFDRIEIRPDLRVLADHWGLDPAMIPEVNDENWETLPPLQVAYRMLDRLNLVIAADLGSEFELGHGLLMPISSKGEPQDEDRVWFRIAKAWDDVLFPQLEDRYSGRPEQLMDLLRVNSPPGGAEFAWSLRTRSDGAFGARALAPVRVSDLDVDTIRRSFQWLSK